MTDESSFLVAKPVRFVVQQLDTSLGTFGRLLDMVSAAVRYLIGDTIRGRHPWRETVTQAWFITSVTAIPAILVSIPFGVIVSVQVGSLTQQVGATSIAGAAGGLGVIRQVHRLLPHCCWAARQGRP